MHIASCDYLSIREPSPDWSTHPHLTGKAVQDELDRHGITLNKNCVPGEKRPPSQASGVRIGTAPMTTKGFTAQDFIDTAHKIDEVIRAMGEQA